jgi:hypothetical protein
MRATDGAVVGYALEAFDGPGVGSVLVLVSPSQGGSDARLLELEAANAALQAQVQELGAQLAELRAMLERLAQA